MDVCAIELDFNVEDFNRKREEVKLLGDLVDGIVVAFQEQNKISIIC